MKLAYRALQLALRKLIDLLMTCWLWANDRERRIREREDYDGK